MTQACQVDFYVLARPGQSAERLACRLAMMAWEQGHHIAVLTADEEGAEALDEIMWDYPPGRFLPHQRGMSDPDAPVGITVQDAEILTFGDSFFGSILIDIFVGIVSSSILHIFIFFVVLLCIVLQH